MLPYTFVQISDIHLGRLEGSSPQLRIFWQRMQCLPGLLGHSEKSLMDLQDFFLSYPEARLVVTGDVTACGHNEEFDLANQYLAAVLPENAGYVGLDVADWTDRAIPGNHDHWAGRPIPLGRPQSRLKHYFANLPSGGPFLFPVRMLR